MAYVRSEGTLVSAHTPPHNQNSWSLNLKAVSPQMVSAGYGWIYENQPNIQTAVSFLARNMAQLGLKAYEKLANDDRQQLEDNPLASLLIAPNVDTTTYRFIEALVSDIGIFDVAYIAKVRSKDTGRLTLFRLPPYLVELDGDNWLTPDGFKLKGDKREIKFNRDEVIYIHGYNPSCNTEGTSPIKALRDLLISEYNATAFRNQLWNNGARISGYIERPLDANQKARDGTKRWQEVDFERFRRQWDSQYTGNDGAKSGGTPILEDGMKFVPVGLSPQAAQYVENRKLTREDVATAYFIPPTMLGILEHATFSNMGEQHKMLYMDTLGPWAAMLEQELRLQLVPDFYPGTTRVYVEFNIREKLQGSFVDQAEATSKSVGAPWMTPNEARKMNNLPALDGGDELVTPLNVTVNNNDGVTEATEEPSNDPNAAPVPPVDEQKLDAFFARQKQVLKSKAGAGAFSFDSSRWKRELLKALEETE